MTLTNKFIGVVYDKEEGIQEGEIVEVFYQEERNIGYSQYIYIEEILTIQQHQLDEISFSVVELKGVNVTDIYLEPISLNSPKEIEVAIQWAKSFVIKK